VWLSAIYISNGAVGRKGTKNYSQIGNKQEKKFNNNKMIVLSKHKATKHPSYSHQSSSCGGRILMIGIFSVRI
jgi:hypothetical protein